MRIPRFVKVNLFLCCAGREARLICFSIAFMSVVAAPLTWYLFGPPGAVFGGLILLCCVELWRGTASSHSRSRRVT